jgi:hypothetical protein
MDAGRRNMNGTLERHGFGSCLPSSTQQRSKAGLFEVVIGGKRVGQATVAHDGE